MTSVETAALAFEILQAGISEMTQGDIHFTGPTSTIGVVATNLPRNVTLKAINDQRQVFSYRRNSNGGIELVNVKIDCYVVYDGPQVQMTVQFPADGMRSRLNNDTYVTIGNPLSIETGPAPGSWAPTGITQFPIVRVPFSIFVDHPWPADNYKVSFMLVLSGIQGFGAPGLGVYENYQEVWD